MRRAPRTSALTILLLPLFATAARAVATPTETRETDKWRERAARLGHDRIRYLSGKRLRQYSPSELGKFQIITDVFGGFTYTDDLSGFVERVLRLLEESAGPKGESASA
jgi:hypothetical protein